jgi:hypothetical protein
MVLLACSAVVALIVIVALSRAVFGVLSASSADRLRGTARVLAAEQSAALGSSALDVLTVLQLCTIVGTVLTADQLSHSLRGAMCAYAVFHGQGDSAGVLALTVEAVTLLLAALCVGTRRVDRTLPRSELLKPLAVLGVLFACTVLLGAAAVGRLLLGLDLRLHASCCSSGFSQVELQPLRAYSPLALGASMALVVIVAVCGLAAWATKNKGPWASVALGLVLASSAGLMPWVAVHVTAPYVFESPTHRCVYCLLRWTEGGWQGSLVWLTVIAAAMSAFAWVASWAAGLWTLSAQGAAGTVALRDRVQTTVTRGRVQAVTWALAAWGALFLPVILYRLYSGRLL